MSTIRSVTRQRRICYAGTYERTYPRNRLVIDALRQAGMSVEEVHVPVFECRRDKSRLSALSIIALLLRLLLSWLWLIPNVAVRLRRCDALMVGYIGQGDMLVLAPLAKAMRRPVIFNPLVTLTDTLVEDRALVRSRSLGSIAISLLDRLSLRLADRVIVDTEQNAAFITSNFRVPASKIHLLPVGANEQVFHPRSDLPRPEARPDVPLDVLFYGKFIPLHGIEVIVRAASILEADGVPAHFELIGTGQTWADTRALAAALDVTTITWTDWLPEAELGARLRRADIALGIFANSPKAARVVPNKVFQSLACRIATITRDSAAARDLLVGGDSALLIPPADAGALAAAIARLSDPVLRQRIAARGHVAYRDNASSDALAVRLAQILDTVQAPT